MLSFLWGLAQGTLGVPLTSPYIGKWSGAAYTLYTFRTRQDYSKEVQPVEWSHQKTFGEVWRHGSGHVVVDVLLGLHHRCQVQQGDDSNDLFEVPRSWS